MKVLVSDTSVLIDLDRGSLVEATFRLPVEFTVPDLLYERELKDHGGLEFISVAAFGLTFATANPPTAPAPNAAPSRTYATQNAFSRSWNSSAGPSNLFRPSDAAIIDATCS